jgi:hypothetical protein
MEANRSSRLAGMAPPLTIQLDALIRWVTSREMAGRWAFLAVASCIIAVQLPVLGMYFVGDDFVPLGDIASHSTWSYIHNLFLLQDPTPNWRFLTGLVYLALYRTFGLNAFVFLFTSLCVHIATTGLLFRFVRRHTDSLAAAATAAALFGVSAAYVPTIAYATAFTHVFGTFLIMLALVTIDEALDREHPELWRAASVVFFALAVMANEPVAVIAPLFAIVALWRISQLDSRTKLDWAAGGVLATAYGAIGIAAISSLAACNCTAAHELTGPGGHIFGNIWIYLGRLVWPIGLEWPGEASLAHLTGGAVVVALGAFAFLRGPAAARIAALFLALTLVPYLPVDWILAPRYVYLAAAPFSILAALLLFDLSRQLRRLSPVLPALAGFAALSAVGLLAWQTWDQNHAIAVDSGRWRTLVTGLHERYPDLPAGSRIYVRGGPLSDPLWQQEVMPAVGYLLWNDVELVTVPRDARMLCAAPERGTYVIDFDGDDFGALLEGRRPSADLIANDPLAGGVPPLIVDCPQEMPP